MFHVPLIPIPEKSVLTPDGMALDRACLCHADEVFSDFVKNAVAMGRKYQLDWQEGEGEGIALEHDAALAEEGFRMTIGETSLRIAAGGARGMNYALGALEELLVSALVCGPRQARLPQGEICDAPRFPWRGFMLDSARHCQPKETILKLLEELAAFRINRFHWHLCDNEGWRFDTGSIGITTPNYHLNNEGLYSEKDIAEIRERARSLGIEIVPEFDIPGHSGALIRQHPGFSCAGKAGAEELCIGNAEVREKIRRIIGRVMELFPDSRYIHLGGDEAETAAWESCPVCRKAMEEKGLHSMRELEHDFMLEMTRCVVKAGRTPIVWGLCSDLAYPEDTVIQCWLDIREPIKVAKHGNRAIYSVHTSLYFDYPENPAEPHESWMFALPREGVYMTDPHIIWPEKVQDSILGAEACLWTETVPSWRVLAKIRPRLPALAEALWSMPEKKDWFDFEQREQRLRAAGYFDK